MAADGSAAICARTESQKRAGKAGWLHRLRDDHRLPPRTAPRRAAPVEVAPPDFEAMMTRWEQNTSAAMLEDYARPRPMTPDERAAFLSAYFGYSGWIPLIPTPAPEQTPTLYPLLIFKPLPTATAAPSRTPLPTTTPTP